MRRLSLNTSRSGTRCEYLVIAGVCSLLLALLGFRYQQLQKTHNRRVCANNLRAISIGMLLYHNTFRSLPHTVTSAEHRQHTDKINQVQKVFQLLIAHKFLDTSIKLNCPSNARKPTKATARKTNSPIFEQPLGNSISRSSETRFPIDQPELSYTYLKGPRVHQLLRAHDVIVADKDYRPIVRSKKNDSQLRGQQLNGPQPAGHRGGLNLLYEDGQVSFVPVSEKAVMKQLLRTLIFNSTTLEKTMK